MTAALQTFVPGRHAYVPNPWKKPECDAKLDDNGRPRLCGGAPGAAVHQPDDEERGNPDAIAANAADAYLVAHSALIDAGMGPERPAAARRLADTWLRLQLAIAARRQAAS